MPQNEEHYLQVLHVQGATSLFVASNLWFKGANCFGSFLTYLAQWPEVAGSLRLLQVARKRGGIGPRVTSSGSSASGCLPQARQFPTDGPMRRRPCTSPRPRGGQAASETRTRATLGTMPCLRGRSDIGEKKERGEGPERRGLFSAVYVEAFMVVYVGQSASKGFYTS